MRSTWRRVGHEIASTLLGLAHPFTGGESPEVQLRRLLDSSAWRSLTTLAATQRRWRDAYRSRRRTAAFAPMPSALATVTAPASTLLMQTPSLADRLTLLNLTFTAGGYETAEELAERMEDAVASAPRALRQRALPLFTRVWVTAGAPGRALRLWQTAGADLSPAHPLYQALRLDAGLLESARWHSEHGFHAYLADAWIQRGALHAAELAQHLASQPWSMLANPEIELVLHNALLGASAEPSAFNRFLGRHGLEKLSVRASGANWLEKVRFAEDLPRYHGGPLVSVLMSARNAAHTITYAVESVLRQTHARLELLIADDGSDDGTLDLLRARYAGDPRVRLFRSERNQGTYNTRNALIEQARGELITFQDADDLSLPTRLARQVAAIRRSGGVGCVSEWLRVRRDGSVAFFWNGRAARLSIVSLMASRAALREAGSYPPAKVGADLDVYRRVLKRHGNASVVRLPTPLLLGLWSQQSLTRSSSSESLESGYRSPVRRRYSELVFRRDLFGLDSLPDALLLAELRALGNYVAPSRLIADDATPPAT